MKSTYRLSRNRAGIAFLIALCLALPLIFTASAQGQRRTGRRAAPPAKKTGTTSAPPQTSTPEPATANAQPDTTKPGTVMANQLGIEFAYIPSGSFVMGSNTGGADERPARRVSIRRGFYIGRYEITQAQWRAVMGDNPSNFKGEDLPVEQVSWTDAQAFVKKLNERGDPFLYRLPTEAEWEYACHGQMTGESMGALDSIAWYFNNSVGKTHPVGEKQPNGWGLHDMLGNVWEWVEDVYHESYRGAPTDGSAWVAGGDQKYRILRGGSWIDNAFYCRVGERIRATPDTRQRNSGLRIVAVPRAQ
ncbi:MAG TPA: formylglycine-generating enzyme family protein [Pyrinomonadaceae bacterium]|jgi:formylglycine-generating enzyme required for sulfatase activity